MTRRLQGRLALYCLAIAMVPTLVCALSTSAWAKPGTKIALAPVEGDKSNEVGKAVTDALEGSDLTVVPPKEVTRVVEKLGYADELTAKQMKKVQAELEAAAYVQGKVDKAETGNGKKLHFNVFINGKKAKGFSLEFTNAKSPKFKKTLKETMIAKVGVATGDVPVEAVAEADKPAKPSKADKKKKKGDDDVEADEAADKKDKKGKGKKDKDKKDKVAAAEPDDEDAAPAKDKKGKKGKKDKDKDKKAKDETVAVAEVPDDDAARVKDKKGKKGKKDKKDKAIAGTSDADLKVEASVESDGPKPKAIDTTLPEEDGSKAKPEGDGEDADKKKPKQVADADVSGSSDAPAVSAKLTLEPPRHAANRVAIRLDLGASFANRTLKYTSRAFTEGMGAPPNYANKPVPAARIDGELYPFAFSNPKGFLGGLGFAGEYDKTLSLKLKTMSQPDANLTAKSQHYEVGIRYRIGLGSLPTSPTVTLAAGYGARSFIVDRSVLAVGNALDMPDTSYKYFDPGLDFRIPIGKSVAFFAGGRALLVTSAGPITEPTGYGQAKILGYNGTGGLDFVFGNRVALRVQGEFTQVGLSFTATGDSLATNRDGDATTPDVSKATDRSIGGAATLGILY